MTTWLFTIAKRVWIDTLRKKKTVSLDEIAEDQFRTDETPEVLFDRKQRMELLMTIIDEIKEPEKSVFLMKAVLDHSYKEIGKALGKSENWTRVTYYHVRMKLMERVKQYEDAL